MCIRDRPAGPQKSSGDIISHAFEMYKGVFIYALLAMILYIVASIVVRTVSGFDSMSFAEEMRSSEGNFSPTDFWSIPGLGIYSGLSGLLGILITPLFVGIIYMANQYNFKQQLHASDLFIGYRQNFVNILIYTVILNIILGISFALCVIPGFFVMPLFLLGLSLIHI